MGFECIAFVTYQVLSSAQTLPEPEDHACASHMFEFLQVELSPCGAQQAYFGRIDYIWVSFS